MLARHPQTLHRAFQALYNPCPPCFCKLVYSSMEGALKLTQTRGSPPGIHIISGPQALSFLANQSSLALVPRMGQCVTLVTRNQRWHTMID